RTSSLSPPDGARHCSLERPLTPSIARLSRLATTASLRLSLGLGIQARDRPPTAHPLPQALGDQERYHRPRDQCHDEYEEVGHPLKGEPQALFEFKPPRELPYFHRRAARSGTQAGTLGTP